MDTDILDIMAGWGDKSTRDTAHLLDLAIAGSIDHLRGHGTVRLLPARLEEIASRIAPRTRDADGAWIVTLAPPTDDLVAVNPYDVLAYVYEAGMQPDETTAFVEAAAVPGITLRDMGMEGFAAFVEWVGERYA